MSWFYERGRVSGKRLLCHHCEVCGVKHTGIVRGVWCCGRYKRVPRFTLFLPVRGSVRQQSRFLALGDWRIDADADANP
jgi:hypothetical protein